MSRQLEAIYRDEGRARDYKRGYRNGLQAAAHFLESWEGQQSKYRLGDLLLMKFNQVSPKFQAATSEVETAKIARSFPLTQSHAIL